MLKYLQIITNQLFRKTNPAQNTLKNAKLTQYNPQGEPREKDELAIDVLQNLPLSLPLACA